MGSGQDLTVESSDLFLSAIISVVSGTNVNQHYGNQKWTALHWAARAGNLKLAQCLLKAGADPCLGDLNGESALHIAARYGPSTIAQALLEFGVNVDVVDGVGRTPLHVAAISGNPEMAKTLVLHGTNVNAQDKLGFTPLHGAVRYHPGMTAYLLGQGADWRIRNNQGETPYMIAVSLDQTDVIEILRAHGADE